MRKTCLSFKGGKRTAKTRSVAGIPHFSSIRERVSSLREALGALKGGVREKKWPV